MRTVLTAERLWDGTSLIDLPVVVIEDGQIASISTRAASEAPGDAQVLDFPGATLAPAFFDVHIHGAKGHDVTEATPAALDAMGSFLASRGTGSYLATTMTAPVNATLRSLSGLAKLLERPAVAGQARPIGIHLEGPFLSHSKRGVQPAEYLLPADIATFDRFFEAAEGHIRLMTLAPELPGAAELAAHATARGVRVSAGPLERHRRRDPRRHCRRSRQRDAYVQRHAPAGPSRAGHSGHGSHLRLALCRVDLRRHPHASGDGEALVESQGAGARHSGDRRHERRRHARRRVPAGRICGAGGQRQSHGRRRSGRQRAHAGPRSRELHAIHRRAAGAGSAAAHRQPGGDDRPERSGGLARGGHAGQPCRRGSSREAGRAPL